MSAIRHFDPDEEKAGVAHHSPTKDNGFLTENPNGLTHAQTTTSTIQNKRTIGFIMTMLGFSISFVVAEVIPLFLITLFTVIAYDLDSGDKAIWLIVAQFIAVGSTVPFVGPLVDLLGRKLTTLTSLLLTIVSMILLGTTPNIAGAIAAMAISGAAIGIQLLTSIAAVTELVPISQRGITIGYIVLGFMPFAPASLYGQLIAERSWRYVPAVIGALATIGFVVISIWYKPPPRINSLGLTKSQVLKRIDFVGAFLSIAGVTLFLVGLNWGKQPYPWNSVHVIACLCIGLGLLAVFVIYEKFVAKYPLFPGELVQHKRLFFVICFLCLTSGVNFIPVVVFWVIQVYTVYGASFREAGIWLLPIGFCIAGGAIISAGLMTVFRTKIQWILLGFCIMQTAGLGCMAAIDPENVNTAFAPLVIGLIGVGGVLLPSQVVFSIISPETLIGTSIALSIVIRAFGQVIGVSMFYNLFHTHIEERATSNLTIFTLPAILNGFNVGLDPVASTSKLITTLTAGPFSEYASQFNITDPLAIANIQHAGHELYKTAFPEIYLVSIAFGGAAVVSCFFLHGIGDFINENVAVHL
ncbi:related to MFS drug efflux pump [Rhynchosporium secalis]|uniref:Related to MFS drug efflux pump n=1 Tax=Rhynchosporium secalis TaxID=38038 RepID=A0A1E1MHK4_RHYSE|nr:related to MFS drug efflux pump [Rhynchosporium secalis]